MTTNDIETTIRATWNEAATYEERPLLVTLALAVARWLKRKSK